MKRTISEWCHQFPDTPNRTLARMIHEETGESSIDVLRKRVRDYRNANGLNPGYDQKSGVEASKKNYFGKLSKVLIFDIEVSHIPVYLFSKWDDARDDDILADWCIICWSAKWLFENEIYSMKLTDREMKRRDDKRIVKGLWKMLDEANVVVGHNIKKYDKRKTQSRFLKHGLYLPSHYQEIDTLISTKKEFFEVSNRLDFLTSKFLGESKIDNPRGLWHKAQGNPFQGIKPDQEAIDQMAIYCDQDVKITEDYYLLIRPYIKSHPNLALWEHNHDKICKACGGLDFDAIGDYTTIVNRYEGFRCKNCGSVHRARRPLEKSNVYLR